MSSVRSDRARTRPAVLVMAKAPVPGEAKTRLGAVLGDEVAARLAAACVLDTLAVCEEVFTELHLALAGDLDRAVASAEIRARLTGWTVHRQRGGGFAERLVLAHADVSGAAGVPVVQIGMDTPHLTAADLADVAGRLGVGNDAVLGPAVDGGWWVLGLTDPRQARCLAGVAMSTDHTYADTLAALRALNVRVDDTAAIRDVDTPADAGAAAAVAPRTRFAREWAAVTVGSRR